MDPRGVLSSGGASGWRVGEWRSMGRAFGGGGHERMGCGVAAVLGCAGNFLERGNGDLLKKELAT